MGGAPIQTWIDLLLLAWTVATIVEAVALVAVIVGVAWFIRR